MTIDATGNEIVIGQRYGYSKQASGFTRVIIGTAIKAEKGKVTLSDIEEKTYIYVYKPETMNEPKVEHPTNKRSLSSVQVFKV